ncbi:MAG TPA: lysylphosphatidylglycerol synthase transmembrane domain-containing protein [Dehalococcoidia bacterium]|nr:lysylphosphatidylglycerol synthase transmembrane domain-containing protein [Dehalococcoidia bacterium]
MLRTKRFWFGLIITVVFFGIFLARTNFSDIANSFSGADYWLAIASVPVFFFGFWFRTLRWRVLMRPVADVPTARLYPVVLIGLMINNITPARVGELVRAYLVGERESISKTTVLGTIAVDRVYDGLTLVAILGVTTMFTGANGTVKGLGISTAVVMLVGVLVLGVLAVSPVRSRLVLVQLIRVLPVRFATRVEGLLDAFLSGLVVIRKPSTLLLAAVCSVASWLIEVTMYYMVGRAFHVDAGFDAFLVVTAAANLALAIFSSPGGVGPFEVTTKEVLSFFGVAGAKASAYALALHVLLLGPVIVVGFVLIWTAQISLQEILGIPKTPVPSTGALD